MLIPSVMSNSVTPWTVAHQTPLSMGSLQARILEWVAMPSSRGVPPQVSCFADRCFTFWATRKSKTAGVGSLSILQGIFPIQESNQGLLHCRQTLKTPQTVWGSLPGQSYTWRRDCWMQWKLSNIRTETEKGKWLDEVRLIKKTKKSSESMVVFF